MGTSWRWLRRTRLGFFPYPCSFKIYLVCLHSAYNDRFVIRSRFMAADTFFGSGYLSPNGGMFLFRPNYTVSQTPFGIIFMKSLHFQRKTVSFQCIAMIS